MSGGSKKSKNINDIRITVTTHLLLDNYGPVIKIADEFSANNIINSIKECSDPSLDHRIIKSLKIISDILYRDNTLSQMKSIFIHDRTEGLLIIELLNSNSEYILSIRI
jgi:hypothetical protein